MKYYQARWDTSLLVISSLMTALCLILAFYLFKHGGGWSLTAGLLLALVAGCALFTVRGYTITPETIIIHRLLWATRLQRAGLQSVQFVPDAMRWSLRTFGNGGFFAFSGWYRNRLLGAYRAFVTDRHQTVVLRYGDRTVVVSPSAPGEFAQEFVARRAG